ncbi:hypothetical protein FGG08_005535 [Glutinoglossum americanum]|uniref:DUF676 domain-containing protein n=1 Tax=Glutinoglossum americanum TaxID=1670608 RepID=A0A9P8I3C9_9PEZI|nr:hypothetical protein FGG08_005535 [Glutinoglossum americanum]
MVTYLFRRLWGNPSHMKYVASALRERYSEERIHILVAKRNSGNFTYDGIELGGERVTHEIEETLEELARNGHEIRKISVIGYSMGGLVARYVIGLLYSKGWFDKLEPVNFTTFATPHLGARNPLLGFYSHIRNLIGARTLSMSGRQLFTIDSFRDTGRPILSVLADPDSIFIRGLRRFKNKSLYANVINDRTAVYYTTGISRTDPYRNIADLKINYVKGYDPVIINPDDPISPPGNPEELPTFYYRIADRSQTVVKNILIYSVLVLLIPIGTIVFLINSVVQSIRSSRRIRLHEEGKAGVGIGSYRIQPIVGNIQSIVEGVFDDLNRSQDSEYLPAGMEEHGDHLTSSSETIGAPSSRPPPRTCSLGSEVKPNILQETRQLPQHRQLEFPTLPLSPHQLAMIQTLDSVGFRKYPVYIHKARHSHAAIIVRKPRKNFDEGKVVMRHWLDNEFEI